MMVPTGGPSPAVHKEAPSKMWLAMVVIVVVVLQIASTTGLFVYLNMSISQVSSCSPPSSSHTNGNTTLVFGWLHRTKCVPGEQSAVFKTGSDLSLKTQLQTLFSKRFLITFVSRCNIKVSHLEILTRTSLKTF